VTSTTVFLFASATVVLFCAHVLRSARHALLFPASNALPRFDLLLGLSLSYAVNALLPFRIGEVVRAVFVAIRCRFRISYVSATIVAERLSDIVVVVAASLAFAVVTGDGINATTTTLTAAGVVLVGSALAIARIRAARHCLWYLASIFNDGIRSALVDFFWSYAQIVSRGELVGRRYLAMTAGMWLLYFAAYGLFSQAVGLSLADVSYALLGAPLRPLVEQILGSEVSPASFALLAFTALPIVGVIVYGAIRERKDIQPTLDMIRRFGFTSVGMSQPITRELFRDQEHYDEFLHSHFGALNHVVSTFGMSGVGDAVVHKLFAGGSDAITALVESRNVFVIRKFAQDAAAAKLDVQADWLRRYRADLSLTDVLSVQRQDKHCRYDMPYLISAHDFYEAIHTRPLASSKRILIEVIDAMAAFHDRTATGDAADSAVDGYLQSKAIANAERILSFAFLSFPGEDYSINGKTYSLGDWERLRDLDWLRAQVLSRDTCVIHGDLTIDNIIAADEREPGWYLIDPNPDNIFDTPLIDWSKLMQSLNLGYESLSRGNVSRLRGNEIHLDFTRSGAYAELHDLARDKLIQRLGAERMREVAFHELVNYLRLTPYKIRQSPHKGLTFLACSSILLRRYLDAYDGSPRDTD
jgi:hypothetical protein